jgi:hypothetical protein
MEFFLRKIKGQARYEDENPTYILSGRRTHLYVPESREWIVMPGVADVSLLNVPNGEIKPISREDFVTATGVRGKIAILEDRYFLAILRRAWELFHKETTPKGACRPIRMEDPKNGKGPIV